MASSVRCPNCKEVPYRWRWTLCDDGSSGKECSLCRHVRPAKPRRSAKRDRFDALIAELLK